MLIVLGKVEARLFDALVKLLYKSRSRVHFNIALIECRFFGHAALEPEVVAIMMNHTHNNRRPREIFLLSLPLRTPKNTRKLLAMRKRRFYWVPTIVVTRIEKSQMRQGVNAVTIKSFGYHGLNDLVTTPQSLPARKVVRSRIRSVNHPHGRVEDPFVTLSLREPIIHQLNDPFRDRKLDDFVASITQLADFGVNVVRMGRDGKSGHRLLDQQTNFYDYASSKIHRLGLEIEYARRSLFCLSSLTGFDALCLALRRPVFYPDSARIWYLFLGTELAYFTLPTFLDSSSRTPLCMSELLERGWVSFKNPEEFSRASIHVEFSQPNEVADYVVSMAKEMLGLITRTDAQIALQESFFELLMKSDSKRVLARHGVPRAKLNISYLEKLGTSFVR